MLQYKESCGADVGWLMAYPVEYGLFYFPSDSIYLFLNDFCFITLLYGTHRHSVRTTQHGTVNQHEPYMTPCTAMCRELKGRFNINHP
jgi:hypothetical protein